MELANINLHHVIKGIADVAMGASEKLLVPDLSIVVSAAQANEVLDELCNILKHGKPEAAFVDSETNLRELIRTAFAAIGVDIEFSGRDRYEKAVVLDADMDLAARLNLNREALMPGQTLVRVSPDR